MLTAGEQIPGAENTEMWFGEYQLNRQPSQPTPQFGVLTALVHEIKMLLDQGRRPLEILSTQRMLYRLIWEAILLAPLTGPDV